MGKGSVFMKKAGIVTAAIILLAVGGILLYRYQSSEIPEKPGKGQGTLVKEYREWKKYYI